MPVRIMHLEDSAMSDSSEVKAKIWNSRFLMFYIIVLLMDTARFMVNPSVPLVAREAAIAAGIAADRIGTIVGLVGSTMGIVAFVLMVIVGPASVSVRPNILMGLCAIGTGVSYFLLSLYSLPFFFAARALDGVCNAFLSAALMMILRDTISIDKSGASMGIFQTRQTIARIIGPLIGVNGLALFFSYVFNFRVAGTMWLALGIACFFFKLKHTEFVPQKFKLNPQNIIPKGTFIPFLVVALFQLTHMGLNTFNMVYARTELGIRDIGLMAVAGNVVAIILGPTLAAMSDKIGLKKGIFISIIVYALGPLTFSLIAHDLPTVCVAAGFQALGFGGMAGMMQSLLVKKAPAKIAGLVGNAYFGGQNLGSFFGPILAGFFVDTQGFKTMYLVMLVPLVFCMILIQAYQSKVDREAAAAKTA
jgi:MFS family permease